MTAFPLRLVYWSLILCGSLTTAQACLWLYGTTIEGKPYKEARSDPASVLKDVMDEKPAEQGRFFRLHKYERNDPVAVLNDEAVQVLLKGNPKRAVKMLHEIEKQHPGVYYTAANLGTAYELSGDDESALKWILEGIKRNPCITHAH